MRARFRILLASEDEPEELRAEQEQCATQPDQAGEAKCDAWVVGQICDGNDEARDAERRHTAEEPDQPPPKLRQVRPHRRDLRDEADKRLEEAKEPGKHHQPHGEPYQPSASTAALGDGVDALASADGTFPQVEYLGCLEGRECAIHQVASATKDAWPIVPRLLTQLVYGLLCLGAQRLLLLQWRQTAPSTLDQAVRQERVSRPVLRGLYLKAQNGHAVLAHVGKAHPHVPHLGRRPGPATGGPVIEVAVGLLRENEAADPRSHGIPEPARHGLVPRALGN
mmetsp:Transcript_5002/g.14692  ORF Transcript_5002/g.14692 Transcript_5002/m.14692 type:complete len:281 (+) Transcript_5002:100-942(+)